MGSWLDRPLPPFLAPRFDALVRWRGRLLTIIAVPAGLALGRWLFR